MKTSPTASSTVPTQAFPLTELPAEACAAIVNIDLDQAGSDRLVGLALCVGRVVEMVQHGDPMIVRACGTRIGLARTIARAISVQPCDKPCPLTPDQD